MRRSWSSRRHQQTIGNGTKPRPLPPQPGCCRFAPLLPQAVQRAHCRSTSPGASAPHKITGAANAIAAKCGQRPQWTHHHELVRCNSPSVGRVWGSDLRFDRAGRVARQRAASCKVKLAGSPLMSASQMAAQGKYSSR
jgi:hypothetical protein